MMSIFSQVLLDCERLHTLVLTNLPLLLLTVTPHNTIRVLAYLFILGVLQMEQSVPALKSFVGRMRMKQISWSVHVQL